MVGVWLGGGLQCGGVAECGEFGEEPAGFSLGVVSLLVVVGAQVDVALVGVGHQVPASPFADELSGCSRDEKLGFRGKNAGLAKRVERHR